MIVLGVLIKGRDHEDMESQLVLEEHHVRDWFKHVDLAQARDTLNVCEGIYEMRLEAQPKRARRKDAGKPRPAERTRMLDENPIDLKELGKP